MKTVMLYLDGSKTALRCADCGSNCFHLTEDNGERIRFECNGCLTLYEAERDEPMQTIIDAAERVGARGEQLCADTEITDGVSSPEWFENIKPIEI